MRVGDSVKVLAPLEEGSERIKPNAPVSTEGKVVCIYEDGWFDYEVWTKVERNGRTYNVKNIYLAKKEWAVE